MYSFFRVVTALSASQLAPADDLMEAAGFRRMRQCLANFGFVRAELWMRNAR